MLVWEIAEVNPTWTLKWMAEKRFEIIEAQLPG